MPNLCDYSMRVVGNKKDILKWVQLMGDYEKENHFWRIFDADVYDSDYTRGDKSYACICGDCAWSIESCCRASGYSNGKDLLAINSKRLNLVVEIWSEESGCCFQEHYVYNKGTCLVDECVDWQEYYYDDYTEPDFEEWKKDNDLPKWLTVDDLEDQSYYVGGFDNYGDWSYSVYNTDTK